MSRSQMKMNDNQRNLLTNVLELGIELYRNSRSGFPGIFLIGWVKPSLDISINLTIYEYR